MSERIPFNKPHLTGMEFHYIYDAVNGGKISGNGKYTGLCHNYFKRKFGFENCLLTSSCTDALEMSALLANINQGDEVIMPSYTFVSTANAFVLRGARIRFVDSREDHPGMDEAQIEDLINKKTRAIIVVHYAGIACDMEKIMQIALRYNLLVIEDAAQAIDSFYTFSDGSKKPLGSIGHLGCFSFHETKNIISGEGGMLVVNDHSLIKRAEIIWEKGTNRSAFFREEVDKYGWVDVGSSFLPSELTAAFLYAQLESLEDIQEKRLKIWEKYDSGLRNICNKLKIKQPSIPGYATNNAHMYYLVTKNIIQRTAFIQFLKDNNILSVFHYQSLHKSEFYYEKHDGRKLQMSDYYTDCLVRLPLFYDLDEEKQAFTIDKISKFEA